MEKEIIVGGQGGGGGTSFEDLGYEPFSETETYTAGDVVIYGGSLYKFATSHTGAWTGTDVTPTSVEAEIEARLGEAPSDGKQYGRKSGAWVEIETDIKVVQISDAYNVELAPNVYNKITSIGSGNALNFTLGTPAAGIVNEYMAEFSVGAVAPTVTFPAAVKWANPFSVSANTTYQISIVNNIAVFVAVPNSLS